MRSLSIINQFLYFFNITSLLILLLSYLSPYVNPIVFWPIAFIGLIFPVLYIINILFLTYWIIILKKPIWINIVILIIGAGNINKYIGTSTNNSSSEDNLKILTYNVRLFNKYNWLEESNIQKKTVNFLESENPNKEISFYINSPGGSITSLFAIYDTMKYIKPDVATVCMGLAASAGAVILAGGTPGKRYSLPHARIMLHQPAGGAEGTSKDIEIQAKLITDMRHQINGLLAEFTKKDIDQITADTDRDFWMTAQEALEYGIVDEVLTQRELVDKK